MGLGERVGRVVLVRKVVEMEGGGRGFGIYAFCLGMGMVID